MTCRTWEIEKEEEQQEKEGEREEKAETDGREYGRRIMRSGSPNWKAWSMFRVWVDIGGELIGQGEEYIDAIRWDTTTCPLRLGSDVPTRSKGDFTPWIWAVGEGLMVGIAWIGHLPYAVLDG